MLKLPNDPGVYIFKDINDTVIYVGKAKNLKKRVKNYFVNSNTNLKVRLLVSKYSNIEFIITNSEAEAFILENNLIKKYKPYFNILLKDDKTYPYIGVTDETFPRVIKIRRLNKKNSYQYIAGPFVRAGNINRFLEHINGYFRLRTCRNLPDKPCLRGFIDKCMRVCVDISCIDEYRENIKKVINIIKGKDNSILKDLQSLMFEAAEKERFEKAAFYRDVLNAIREFKSSQIIEKNTSKSFEVYGISYDKNRLVIVFHKYIEGKMIISDRFEFDYVELENEIIRFFFEKFINRPNKTLALVEQKVYDILSDYVTSINAIFKVPKAGYKKKVLELAKKNSEFYTDNRSSVVEDVKTKLNLSNIPYRIECYDISNIGGNFSVGSMVVFENGLKRSSEYRKFKIKSVIGSDDFASLAEVIERRFQHKEWSFPDLVLIDGGKGQLSSVLKMIPDGVEALSIAKKEEIIIDKEFNEYRFSRDDRILKLFQSLRDEAHRFAITHYRSMHSTAFFNNELLDLKGIGEKTINKLMKNFKSYDKIKSASLQELVKIISKKQASIIYRFFNGD